MDQFGAVKVGGGNATQILEILRIPTLANMAAGCAPTATASFTASAAGLRLYHTNVRVSYSAAPASALFPVFVAGACLTADTVTFTAMNPAATARSGSAIEAIMVEAIRQV